MKKQTLLVLLAGLLIPLISQGQQVATGTVYNDQNSNGTMEASETGIPDVAVSNGREVVTTNDKGCYEIPVDDDDILFVIQPAGYRLPVNEYHLPQFYYTHKPNGSPDMEFEGVAPTGELPEAVNFALLPDTNRTAFDILVFGDPQPYTREQVGFFDQDIVEELVGVEGYVFGISLGDLVGNDLDLLEPYNEAIARIGLPWFNVYGNHDMNFDAPADSLADETYERVYGPATYSFNEGKVHFIIIDDVFYPRTDGEDGYIGGFTDEQLTFIEHDLNEVPKDHLVVLAFHIPILEPEGWGNTFREEDRAALFELLEPFDHTLSLSAHTHLQRIDFMGEPTGWSQSEPHLHYNVGTTSGDWWSGVPGQEGIPPTTMRDGTPNGFASIHFDGSDFQLNYTVAGDSADVSMTDKMGFWGPRVVPQDSWHSAQLYVNYYLGSDSTQVAYRMDEQGTWQAMQRVSESDPNVEAFRQHWDQAGELLPGRRPSNPVPSTHLWKTGVPNDLPLGTHTIEVRVRDMFGRTFTDTFTYKVVKPSDDTN